MTAERVLFTDFDGTMTDVDFFELVLDGMRPDLPVDPVAEFRAGRLTLFEALRRVFAAIPMPESEVRALLPELRPDPHLADDFARLAGAGWEVHVVSAGCAWYIEALLADLGIDPLPPIHANPGRFLAGRGLVLEHHEDPRIARDDIGIDKAAIVRLFSKEARTVAFAGNSPPDLPAARLVEPELRFARGSLPAALDAEGLSYRRFETWHGLAESLLTKARGIPNVEGAP